MRDECRVTRLQTDNLFLHPTTTVLLHSAGWRGAIKQQHFARCHCLTPKKPQPSEQLGLFDYFQRRLFH